MIKKLFNTTLLFVISNIALGQTQIGTSISGDGNINRFGGDVALSSDGLTFASGASSFSGYVKVYTMIGNNWILKGNKIFGDGSSESFGNSVSLSSNGNILSVGAYTNNSNTGCVRVYTFNGTNWIQIGITIYGENINDYFGQDVALSADGTILAIGAYGNDINGIDSGHVRVFKYISNSWVQLGTSITGDMAGDRLGYSLSLSPNGNVLAVGAHTSDGNGIDSGQVKTYSFNGSDWIQLGNNILGENAYDNLGSDVSLSSNGLILAAGAVNNDGNGLNSGHTRVYNFNGSNWIQIGNDINGEAAGDLSGNSVSLSSSGNILAIGAYQNDGNGTNSGQARIYNLVGNNWLKVGNDIDGSATDNWFGTSVSLSSSGSIVCIGGSRNNSNGFTQSGQVKVFDLSAILSSDSFVLENFKVFPNPTSEQVTIALQENLQLEKVNIYNTVGQLIKTEKNNTINVSNFAKGSYFFEVITNKGKAAKTIVIQ